MERLNRWARNNNISVANFLTISDDSMDWRFLIAPVAAAVGGGEGEEEKEKRRKKWGARGRGSGNGSGEEKQQQQYKCHQNPTLLYDILNMLIFILLF